MLDAKIQTFVCVVEKKSYTVAAEFLHLTQPAVTQHIHKLEAYYGCKLIDSTRRSVKPTKAGELLYEYLSQQQANEQRFAKLLTNVVEPLRIGATLSIADYYLPKILVEHILKKSQRVRVTVGNTPHLLELLHSGEIDCAFIEGIFDITLFDTRVFSNENFLPVISSGHPLANKEVIIDDLHNYPLVLREPYSGTREIFENWLKKQNDATQAFSQVIEMGSFILIKELVKNSNAITFLYEGVVKKELESGELISLNLKDFKLTHPLLFVFRKGDPRSKLLTDFFDAIGK